MAKAVKVKVKAHPAIMMEAEVARKIRQHSRSSMKAEVCGVLIGTAEEDRTAIEACIAGVNAAQGGAHVTFTQDTWEHIYKIKDRDFPDHKIVGWYHSHPGFGVFLSEHDLFIQQNFFSNPQQVAWVFDPHTDEEGCFGWVNGKIEKLNGVRFGFTQEMAAGGAGELQVAEDEEPETPAIVARPRSSRDPAWVVWSSRVLVYLSIALLGFAGGYVYSSWRMAPFVNTCQVILEHPIEACQDLLKQYSILPSNGPATSTPAGSQNRSTSVKPGTTGEKLPAGKGTNEQH